MESVGINHLRLVEDTALAIATVGIIHGGVKSIVYYILESIQSPTSNSQMSKVIPMDSIDNYLREDN